MLNARAACRPELGGVERWAREVIARLERRHDGYVVARPPATLVHRAGHAWEQLMLPARAAAARASLIFCPANLAPLAWPANVVVLHDAAALRGPEWYSGTYATLQRLLLPRIARRALHVVTVSQFSRRELIGLLDLPPSRVSVIPGGVDERFTPQADAAAAAAALDLRGPYVLCVASTTARKNLGALDAAATRLRDAGLELVVAGGDRPQFRDEGGPDGGLVRRLGRVDDEWLPGLYAGALAFVLPSLYEGFGLTCLEAMACGVPVVAADRGALPETCAGAAVLVEPTDERALADAVDRATSDPALRARLREAGLARATQLTWDGTADAVHELLMSLRP